jgi:hypothetical protein
MTQELVQYLFEYSYGSLYWKVKVTDKINIGQKAGNKSGKFANINFKENT